MTFTITDTAVFDGDDLLAGRHDVRVDGGTVTAVTPAGAVAPSGAVVDAAGATLLPGLIDGHVHFQQPVDFSALLAGGVTSAADMASWPPEHLADLRSRSGGIVFTTPGAPLIGPAGPHSHMPGLSEAVIDSPEAARREVAIRVAQGVDYIKLVLEAEGRGGPEPDAARAAVEAAHAAGLRVVAHASSVGAIALAVEIGVDILTHAPLDGTVAAETIARIVEQGIVVVPTLIMMRTVAEARGVPQAYANARAFATAIHDAGVVIVAGSDANSAPGSPAAVFHGTGARDETGLLVDAGLSPVEALRAATSTSAELYGFENRGVIRPGSVADLLLVNGDPTADIAAVGDIRGVWLAGRRVS
ncbi:amidohydrolase family protein [Subtercola boreus]|uniref:Amidohydrolase-related domain-containing protein n=1 Tax=Subtercola boreus TaxID=120213 RepID=A0A3E0WD40_9MICO|nr:amidohydrolase family protein [Subtercola boreus]RFA22732.1 hypothetical protein B7R24_03765 [Subtercola boreus]RFA23087.1 hypothetical protein B7R23_03760 [Subtercola boreus]RFA28840.1 hypothetical protein B7R25_03775 [Subtercola boreus]